MFKFLLGPKSWRNKTEERYFSTVPKLKLLRLVLFLQISWDQKYCFFLWNNDLFLFFNDTSLYLRILKPL